MIFKAPELLLFSIALPMLWKLLVRAHHLQNQSAEKLRGKKTNSKRWKIRIALQLASVALLILALAQPAWNPKPAPLPLRGRDLVIALDISRSMLATDVFPSRLDSAKISLYESLELLQGQKIGLITFAGSASIRVPLTLDHNFIRFMLQRAAPSNAKLGSTSLQSAIEKTVSIALNESKRGMQDIILFTDGEDHLSDIEETHQILKECGARVLIVGIGDPVEGAKIPAITEADEWMTYDGQDILTRLDEQKLVQLSDESPNVVYHAAHTRPFDLISLYHKLITDTADMPVSEETQVVYTDGYPLFIAVALGLWLTPLLRTRRIHN